MTDIFDFMEQEESRLRSLSVDQSLPVESTRSDTASTQEDAQWISTIACSNSTPAKGVRSPSTMPRLWKTVPTSVDLKRLVWAPYYRFRNKLFCARLCEDAEAITVKTIHYPIKNTEAVVEFFCLPEGTDTKLLLVERKSLLPFYAARTHTPRTAVPLFEEDISDNRSWNSANVDAMLECLRSNFSIAVAKQIHDRIVSVADQFLTMSLRTQAMLGPIGPDATAALMDSLESHRGSASPSTPNLLLRQLSKPMLKESATRLFDDETAGDTGHGAPLVRMQSIDKNPFQSPNPMNRKRKSSGSLQRMDSSQSQGSEGSLSQSTQPTKMVSMESELDLSVPAETSHEIQVLSIGDTISFYHKVFPDVLITTKIVGFTANPNQPLDLETNDVMRSNDRLMKLNQDGGVLATGYLKQFRLGQSPKMLDRKLSRVNSIPKDKRSQEDKQVDSSDLADAPNYSSPTKRRK